MKPTNVNNGRTVAVLHGEVFLLPVDKMPEGKTEKHKSYIVGHSETGHHHMLESDVEFEVMPGDETHDLFVRLFQPTPIKHKKTFDIHETQIIAAGDYAIYQKQEYDPFAEVMRRVYD